MDCRTLSPEMIRALHIINKAPEHIRQQALEKVILAAMDMADTPEIRQQLQTILIAYWQTKALKN